MKSDKLRDWLEIVGIFSVVASLIFVGLQMRQAHEISLSQAYQSRTAAAVEWNSAFASNPDALSAFRKAADGAEDEITAEEHEALRRTILGVILLYDNAHYQYQQEFVSEEFWQMTRGSMKSLMSYPVIKTVFLQRLDWGTRPGFRSVVLAINEELEAVSGE